jgi:hypothetical protein
MFKLSLIAGIIFLSVTVLGQYSQSPHGRTFTVDCARCHTDENWEVSPNKVTFNHDSTDFPLVGQHQKVNCKNCHPTLIFTEAKTECSDCHTDIHQQTVGYDCARCHNNNSWVVTNVSSIHRESRFPLMGAHKTADCSACHKSASNLQFEALGTECINCHSADYYATTNPNHTALGYSTNCYECHSISSLEWKANTYTHDFFPLVQGHSIPRCNDCHGEAPYQKVSSDCWDCHEADYNQTTSPNHAEAVFSSDCASCHSLSPGWTPAKFTKHDAENFPIYSGKHKGAWSSCSKCHTNESDYSSFSCTACHEHSKSRMDSQHNDVRNYVYESNACYSCHPRGREEGD